MGYDLYFTAPKISLAEFESYFSKNKRYEVSNGQAWYNNQDTGVYFVFEHDDSPPEEEDDISYSVSFSLNFYRPHYFALEAEPEIRKFIDHFGCSISDSQNEGMGESGPYSAKGFIRGWNVGNEFGYRAFLNNEKFPDPIHSRPTAELQAIWSWNLNRDLDYSKINEDIFIPRVFFILLDGKLGSVAVWPDAISALLPATDFLYIPRKELAPKPWFRKREEDFCVLTKPDYPSFFQQYETKEFELPAYKLPTPDTPSNIKDFVRKQTAYQGTTEGIGIDQVLNAELVEQHKNKAI